MQTSAAIAAAAVAQERNPVATLNVDWDADGSYSQSIDNLSPRLESLVIQRQLATDLPETVTGVAGYSVATLTAVLSGDPTTEADNAGSYFSPFNTASALYGKRRRWRTCQVQVGFDSTLLPVFTGKTTSVVVDAASRTATLDALDNAETMRGHVDLPLVVADDKRSVGSFRPGLNASWVVDYIARACGYYAAPPRRSGCVFDASFAGSAYPAVGTMSSVRLGTGLQVAYVPGKFVQAAASPSPSTTSLVLNYTLNGSLSTNNGGELLLEGWANIQSGVANGVCEVTSSLNSGTANKVSLTVDATGHLQVSVRRTSGGAITTYASGLTVPTGQLAYLAAHVHMTSSTITIQWRVNGTAASTSAATTSVTGQPALVGVAFDVAEDAAAYQSGSGLGYEAWQVSNPAITTGTPTWNDAYAGNATIQPSLNSLAATYPDPTATAWDVIQQLAAAEFATAGFDESGAFTFYNRNRWTSAPYTTSQRTLNAADSLTAVATSETTDQVRNHVRIAASPATLNAAGWVWAASDAITVAASASATVTADTGTPVYGLSTSIRYASTSGLTGQSQYRANRNRDGSGTAVSNLTFSVAVVGQVVTVTITNPNAFAVYLVTGSGFTDPQGTPSLALWGQPVSFGQAQQPDTATTYTTSAAAGVIDVSDATSIGQHGDQLLELSGNPWLQDATSLTTLAGDLLARLKDPPSVLDGLTIIGDPRLQLGDRVTVVEPNLGLNSDFFITGITLTLQTDGGLTQALTVRAI